MEAGTTSAVSGPDLIQALRRADGRVLTILQHRGEGEALIPPGHAVRVKTGGRAQRVLAAPPAG